MWSTIRRLFGKKADRPGYPQVIIHLRPKGIEIECRFPAGLENMNTEEIKMHIGHLVYALILFGENPRGLAMLQTAVAEEGGRGYREFASAVLETINRSGGDEPLVSASQTFLINQEK